MITKVRHCASDAGGPNYYEITSVNRNGESVVARRRFDDLVQLHEDFKIRFRGCVIPFRPGKTLANSSMLRTHSDNFLRARAYAIKCYLNKIAHHPEMKESTVMHLLHVPRWLNIAFTYPLQLRSAS